jgi:hypothetical protein
VWHDVSKICTHSYVGSKEGGHSIDLAVDETIIGAVLKGSRKSNSVCHLSLATDHCVVFGRICSACLRFAVSKAVGVNSDVCLTTLEMCQCVQRGCDSGRTLCADRQRSGQSADLGQSGKC